MKYSGKDKESKKCMEYIRKCCVLKRTPIKNDYIEIYIYTNDEKERIACIKGFLYKYEMKNKYMGKNNAFHIKSLGTNKKYFKRGFATYLMKEAIKYAEYKKVAYITVHPYATTYIIKQEDLEDFYKKFTFTYNSLGIKKEKEIEFKSVSD